MSRQTSTNQLINDREVLLHEYARPFSQAPSKALDAILYPLSKFLIGTPMMPLTRLIEMTKLGGAEGTPLASQFECLSEDRD